MSRGIKYNTASKRVRLTTVAVFWVFKTGDAESVAMKVHAYLKAIDINRK